MKEIAFANLNFNIVNSYKIMRSRMNNLSTVFLFKEFEAKPFVYKCFFGTEIEFEIQNQEVAVIDKIDELLSTEYGNPDFVAPGVKKVWKQKDCYIVHGIGEEYYQRRVHIIKICFKKPASFMLKYETYNEYVNMFDAISERRGLRYYSKLDMNARGEGTVLLYTENYRYFVKFTPKKYWLYSAEKKKEGQLIHLIPSWETKGKYKTIRDLYDELDSFFVYLEEYDTSLNVRLFGK